MSKFIGRRGSVGAGVESTRGTAQVTTLYWIPFSVLSFDDKVEKVRESSAFGNLADSDSAYTTSKFANGNIEGDLYAKSLGAYLYSIFGTTTPTLSETGVYSHAYTLAATNQHKSLTLTYKDPNENLVFKMGMIDEFKITVEPKGIVSYTAGFASMASNTWGTLTPAFTSLGAKFLHQHLQVKVAANIAGIGAATPIDVKKLELTIKKNVENDNVCGTLQPGDIVNKEFSVEGSITINRNDNTFKTYGLTDVYKAMQIVLDDPTLIGATLGTKLTIQMPRVDFTEWEQDRSLGDLVTETFTFKANYDAVNGLDQISTCTLVNTVVSY